MLCYEQEMPFPVCSVVVVSLKIALGPRPVVTYLSGRSPMQCACLVTERTWMKERQCRRKRVSARPV